MKMKSSSSAAVKYAAGFNKVEWSRNLENARTKSAGIRESRAGFRVGLSRDMVAQRFRIPSASSDHSPPGVVHITRIIKPDNICGECTLDGGLLL